MVLISDGLLIGGALAAAFYCYVLARRVRMLGDLDRGLGSAIASLSQQVEDLQVVLSSVKAAAGTTQQKTDAAAERAERAANRLQLLLATTQLAGETGTGGSGADRQPLQPQRNAAGGSRGAIAGSDAPEPYKTAPQPGEFA